MSLCSRAGPRALRRPIPKQPSFLDWWFGKPPMASRPRMPGVVPEKPDPKTYFANERTFLSWLHMAVTMGSIAAAMLGFSSSASHDDPVRFTQRCLHHAPALAAQQADAYCRSAGCNSSRADITGLAPSSDLDLRVCPFGVQVARASDTHQVRAVLR